MKEKRLFFLYFFLCLSLLGGAQDLESDSLKAALKIAAEDTVKVNLLLNLSKYYLNSTPEVARQYSMQALELSNKLRYQPGRALALKNIGAAYYFLGQVTSTLDYYGQSLLVYDSIKDLEGKAMILNNFGTVYYMKGTDDKALDNYFKSLEVAEQIGNKARIATAYSNIGNVYLNKRATTDKALDFFLKAFHMSEEIGDKNIIGGVSVNLGEIYLSLNKDDSALYYFKKSLKAYENTINVPYPLRDIGIFYEKRGDFNNAVTYLERSFQTAQKFDSKLDMTQSLNALGDTYYSKGDYKLALGAYLQSESIAGIIPAYKELDDAYAGLASTYSQLGDYNNAFKFQKLFSNIADTLNNQALSNKLADLQTNFEIISRQNQINLLTKDKKLQELDLKSQKIQKAFMTVALILIFVIAFIIYRGYRSKAKTNKILDKQKIQIENLLQNILPSEVAAELQRDGRATPRYYENVSVLFTDFKGFTRHADALSPQEIVSELNSCFVAFDDIIEKYNLEKIKTIGDAYMCAGGIPSLDEAHPINIIKASLEIQSYMKMRNEQRVVNSLPSWELRIGIHIGPVVAGVVGRKKYAYDIWGSTVNIASRMESNGEPGQVNISASTYELVKGHYECTYRGKVSAKNIGDIDMYFVERAL